MRRGLLEQVVANDNCERSLLGIERGLLDQHFVKARVVQGIGLAQIGGKLFSSDIVENNLKMFVSLQSAHQEVHRTPEGFERFKVGMVEDGAHGGGQGGIDGGNKLILTRVLGRDNR